jgi:Zn-dependent peptidase ImmA (M78 family)
MPTLLTTLRNFVPARPLGYAESLRLAELQAARLLAASGIEQAPVPESIISDLPRLRVIYDRGFSSSGSTAWSWSKGVWQLAINAFEPRYRQRFSIAHEFKHILDDPYKGLLYPPLPTISSHDRQERICDYFAACLLMPAPLVRAAYRYGLRTVPALATHFVVSQEAMKRRLEALGLLPLEPTPRHIATPTTTRNVRTRASRHLTNGIA